MNQIANTKTGKYEGHVLENGVIEFLGVPYAKPPKRWKPAEKLEPSSESFVADTYAPACWQEVQEEEWSVEPPFSEDCLYLNVWTSGTEEKKPVLVWIHGGSYATGSARIDCFGGIYCGDKFVEASRDIVFVNIQYRIGIFGGCDLSKFDKKNEYTMSQNLQTLDQIRALEWIHENIEAFGGDPERVTISGQSAGGFSVATLLALPEANQYFRGGICQSTAICESQAKHREDSQKQIEKFYDIAGAESLQQLLDMPAEQLRDYATEYFYSSEMSDPGPFEQIWGEGIFCENPIEALENGVSKHVNLMIGTVAGEFDTASFRMTNEEIKECGMGVFPDKTDAEFVKEYVSHYPERDIRTAYQDLWNDVLLRIGTLNTAGAHSNGGGKTFLYYIPYLPEGAKIRPQHCFEIPYAHNKKDNLAYMDFTTDEPVQGNHPLDKLQDELHGCWANFVRNGDPNGDHIEIEWKEYNTETQYTAVVDHMWSLQKGGVRAKDIAQFMPLCRG